METVAAALRSIKDLPWSEIRSVADLTLYYLAVIAALWALVRIKTILQVIVEFNKGRGPLWDLKNTVNDIKDLAPAINKLRDDFVAIADKVDSTNKQLVELQVESIGTRLDVPLEDETEQGDAPPSAAASDGDTDNWTKLRLYWKRNADRLEFIIESIPDGRTKAAYDRLPRTNLTRIVNKLQGQKLIAASAAKASRDLIDLFNSYRPRNRPVPDEVAQSLEILDGQLDRELVPYAKIVAERNAEDAQGLPEAPRRIPPIVNVGGDPQPPQATH